VKRTADNCEWSRIATNVATINVCRNHHPKTTKYVITDSVTDIEKLTTQKPYRQWRLSGRARFRPMTGMGAKRKSALQG